MTPERLARLAQVLDQRQPDLTVVMDEVNKPHNLSAIIRSADAVGVAEVQAVWPKHAMRMVASAAKGSHDWVLVHTHPDIGSCVATLKARGMQVLATHLDDTAVDYRAVDYTRPTAILFGAEKYGLPQASLALADQRIIIPMHGMVQSLNVSVAAALILYEAQRQRQLAGLYQSSHSRLPESEQQRLLFERGYPVLTRMCRQKQLPYPTIDAQGELQADESWWQQMQLSRRAWRELEQQAHSNDDEDEGDA